MIDTVSRLQLCQVMLRAIVPGVSLNPAVCYPCSKHLRCASALFEFFERKVTSDRRWALATLAAMASLLWLMCLHLKFGLARPLKP